MILYNCRYNRQKSDNCTCKIKIHKCDGRLIETGKHDLSCSLKSGIKSPLVDLTNIESSPSKNPAVNFSHMMRERAEFLALDDISKTPKEIWLQIVEEMNKEKKTWKGLSDNQIKNVVKNRRAEATGGDIFREMEKPKYAMVKDSNFWFMQFNIALPDPSTNKLHRIMGYGNPSLFGLLHGKVQLFIDGTFKIVPHPFYQCLIIMVYDVQTQVYVPIMFILMTGKTETLYYHVLHWVIVASNWKFDPNIVTCDFEKALHKAISDQFDTAEINGCLSHFKQALRRKMIKSKFSPESVEMAMTKNVMDVLTILPRNEILTYGIPYVRSCIIETADKEKWDMFWNTYFIKFWMSSDNYIATWNIADGGKTCNDLQNRTNNPLESYNRKMNGKFSTPHPSFPVFVMTIEEEARDQVQRLENIRLGREKPPKCDSGCLNRSSTHLQTFCQR